MLWVQVLLAKSCLRNHSPSIFKANFMLSNVFWDNPTFHLAKVHCIVTLYKAISLKCRGISRFAVLILSKKHHGLCLKNHAFRLDAFLGCPTVSQKKGLAPMALDSDENNVTDHELIYTSYPHSRPWQQLQSLSCSLSQIKDRSILTKFQSSSSCQFFVCWNTAHMASPKMNAQRPFVCA